MAITFDPATSRIILDSASVTATEIYSRWVDWAATSDNLKYGMVIRQVGSDDLGGGLSIPPYYFLQGSWRVRPMESSHTLIITGNLFVEGGGVPVVNTLGNYNVAVQYTVPVQAQGISTSGSTGPSASEIAAAILAAAQITPIHSNTKLIDDEPPSSGSGATPTQIAEAVRTELSTELANMDAKVSKTLTTTKFLGLQ